MTDQTTPEAEAKKVLDGEGLFDLMVQQSQTIFLDPNDPDPSLPVGMFFAVDSEGDLNLLHTPWSNEQEKAGMLFMLKLFFRSKGITMYGLAQETWSVERSAKERALDDRQPSQCDDRKEHIFYAVVQPGKRHICRRQEILRPWDGGHPTLGPIEDLPYDSVGGRMLELLDPIVRVTRTDQDSAEPVA